MDQDELNMPMRADNAEDNVKCPDCGGMFDVGMISGDDEMISCPYCGRQVSLNDAQILGASNEEY